MLFMPVSETRTDIRPIKVFHDLPKKIKKKKELLYAIEELAAV